jgi:molecular chaperone DnaK
MIEVKNEAESLIHNTEKQIKENDAKLPQDLKDRVRADINALNEALVSNNLENAKNAIEKFRNSAMDIGRTIYQNASQQNTNEQQQTQEPPKQEEKKDEKKDEQK